MKIPFHRSLEGKITGGVLLLVLAVAVVGAVSYYQLKTIEGNSRRLMEQDKARCLVKDIIIKNINVNGFVEEYLAAGSRTRRASLRIIIADELRIMREFIRQSGDRNLDERERRVLGALGETFRRYEHETLRLLDRRSGSEEYRYLNNRLLTQTLQFDRIETELMYQFWDSTRGRVRLIERNFYIFMLIALVLGLALRFFNRHFIIRPLTLLAGVLERFGGGDFQVRAPEDRRDELGFLARRFNVMLDQIKDDAEILREANRGLESRNEETARTRLYLQNIIDSMPSLLVGVDPEGVVTHWNLAAERYTGVSREGALGRPVWEVFPGMETFHEKISAAMRDRAPLKEERVAGRAEGDTVYHDYMIYPLVANGVEGAVIRVDDVSARVRMEEMMVHTAKMISVGGLAAGMAHEINNPLGGIMMGATNVMRRVSPEVPRNHEVADELGIPLEKVQAYMEKREILKLLGGIVAMGERAARIVRDMLSFSRRSESRKVPSRMPELIDRTVELASHDYDLRKRYDFRHIEIVREYEPGLPPVPCVPTEIEQVLLNLLKNAAQAMAEKSYGEERPRITLRALRDDETVLVAVEDNGPGMEEGVYRHIFEPFYTTKTVGMGTGLGLSVSYFIITSNHGGTIRAESEPGRGSRFLLRLPLGAGK